MRAARACALLFVWALSIFCAVAFAETPREQAWRILDAGVVEKNAEKRAHAVHALGLLIQDRKAVTLVENALEDAKPEVREAAAIALGQMKSKGSIDKLKRVLADREPAVVLAAAGALASLGDSSAYEVYYAVLTGERKTGGSLLEEQAKTFKNPKSMAKFTFEQGVGWIPIAGIGWEVFQTVTKDDVSPVRAAAAQALAKDPDPKSGEALVEASKDKSWIVRVAALDALAKRGEPRLLKGITAQMSDSRDTVRYIAAAAVIRLSAIEEGTKGKR